MKIILLYLYQKASGFLSAPILFLLIIALTPNKNFAGDYSVTGVTVSSQSIPLTYGTGSTTTYTLTLTESGNGNGSPSGATSTFSINWTAPAPAGTSVSGLGTSVLLKGNNQTVSFTITSSGTTPAATTSFTISSTNNSVTSAAASFIVNKAPLTITGLTANNKTYNGLTTATLSGTAAYSGLQNGESFSVTGSPSASFASAGVGTSKVVTISGYTAPSSNYTVTQPSLFANIDKAILTITAANQSVLYGTPVGTVTGAGTYTPTGFVNSETATVISGTVSYTTSYTTTTAASTAGVTITPNVSGLSATNYSFSSANGTITITKANSSLSITGATSFSYNGLNQGPTTSTVTGSTGVITYSYSGTGATTYGPSATLPINAGNYQVVATVAADTNFNGVSSAAFAFAITTVSLTITGLTANNKTYNGLTTATLSGTAAYSGLQNGESFSVTGSPSASFASAGVGTSKVVTISGYTAPSSNYTVTQPSLFANIDKAILTITAANQSVLYGTPVGTVTGAGTYTPTGFVNSETATVISGTVSYTTSYTTTTAASTAGVTITPNVSGLSATNYSFSSADGTITITKANSSLSITGATSFSYNGLNQGPTTSTVTGSTGAITYSYSGTGATTYGPIATLPINAGNYQVVATVAADTNFNGVSSAAFAFAITTASLTITANGDSKSFGQTFTVGAGSTAFTSTALQNGETIGSITIASTGALNTAGFGTYPIVPTAATGGSFIASNYSITYTNGTLTVNKANITVTASDQSKTYGNTSPTSGTLNTNYTVSGLQNSDAANGTTLGYSGSPAGNLAAATTGSYTITPSGLILSSGSLSNYTITYTTGTLTLIAANPTSATASPTTLCLGASTTLNLIGGGGESAAQVKWYANSCFGTTIGTGNNLSVYPSVTTTYYGKYEGVYTTACTSVTVVVIPVSEVGAVSANQTICSGNAPSTDISVASATGTIQWQKSDDASFSSVTNIGTNSTILTAAQIGVLTSTKYFRAIVTSGTCTSATSATVTVTVSPTSAVGAVSANQLICSGNQPSSNITITSATGIIQWQSADNASFTSGLTIVGTNSTTLMTSEVGSLTTTKYFRAVVTSGVCPSVISGTVIVTVNALPVSGTLTPNGVQTGVCVGMSVSATATFGSGGAGTITDILEVSLSGGAYAAYTSGATISTVGQTSVSIRTYRTATGSGCNSSTENTVSWIVNPLPNAIVGANLTIYRGDSIVIGTTAVASNTYSWVSNPTGFTSAVANPSVAPIVNTTYTLTETTPQGCVKSNSVTISVTDKLTISKSLISTPAPTKPGDIVTYQINYSNLNTGIAAQNVVITDLLPSASLLSYTSSSPAGTYNAGSNTLTWNIASLAPGNGTITITGKVGVLGAFGYEAASNYISNGSSIQTINNSATISNAVTPTISSNVVSNSVSQNCGPSMPATISGQIKSSTGSNVYYFIEVINNGNITDRFTLSNTVQTGQSLTSVITNMAGDAITLTPWIAPGQKYGFLVQVTTPPGSTPPGTTNHTYITATSVVCNTTSNSDITSDINGGSLPTSPDLMITKTASSSSVVAGTNITYTISVRNLKSNNANDVVIDDYLPASMIYINNTATQTGGAVITWNSVTRLLRATRAGNYNNSDANIVITIPLQTTCSSVPSVINSATVSNSNGDENVVNNESNVSVTVTPNVADPSPISSSICSGTSTTVTMPSPGANLNYKWHSAASGGTLLQTNGNTYITGNLTSSTTYYVSQYNTLSPTCESNRTPILVSVVSAPVVNSQPVDHNSCSSPASFTYNVTGTVLSQQWQLSTDGGTSWSNIVNGGVYSNATSQTLNISNVTGLYGYKYKCLLNSSTCYSLTSNVVSITTLPTITGVLNVCLGSSITLSGSGIPHASTPWTSVSPAVATVSNTGVVTSVAAGTTVITYMNSNGCSKTTTVTVNAMPNNVSNGFSATTICSGGTPQLIYDAIDATYTTPYSITYKNNASPTLYTVSVTSKDAFAFTPGDNPTSNAGYTLVSITNATCTNNVFSSFGNSGANLIVRPLPTATISGTTSVCAGAPSPIITFTNPQTVAITVTYTINGGINQTIAVPNSTSSNITVPTITAGNFVYTLVSVVYSTGPNCTQSLSGSAIVTINPTPSAPSVSTTQPTCAFPSGTITITGVSGETYSFDGGSYTSTLVYPGLAQGTTHTVFAKNASGCISAVTNVTLSALATKVWNGSWSPNAPLANGEDNIEFNSIVSGTFNSTSDIKACSCELKGNVTVNLISGHTLTLTNKLTVATTATMTFFDGASLVQINNVANSGDIDYIRQTTSFVRNTDYTYWSSPVIGLTLGDVSKNKTKADKYFSFNGGTQDWQQESASTSMLAGHGYIIRGPEPASGPPPPPSKYVANFVGTPHNGDYNVSVSADSSYLIGNPYPSAINADAFLNFNANVLNGTLYFWTHSTAIQNASTITDGSAGSGEYAYTSNDYAVYNATGGVAASQPDKNPLTGLPYKPTVPSGYIGAGQGFFASSKTSISGSSLVFNNAMRVGGSNTQFFKIRNPKFTKAIEKNRIWLNMTNTQGAFKQTLVGYITDATNNFDERFDGESFDGNEFIDFYSVNDNKSLTIQGRALPFDDNDEVALGFKTIIEGNFTINIDQTDGSMTNQSVFIEDKLTKTEFDLKNGNYTFSTVPGTFNDRFVLKYKASDKTLATSSIEAQSDKVLVSVVNKRIKIEAFAETIDKIVVYDLLGRQIYQKNNVDSNELSITNLISSNQALLIKTTLQNGKTQTDKIIY